MRLDVGVFGAKEFLGAIDGQLLDFVGVFAASVVALPGVAFGVFVGKNPSHGFEDCFGNEILRGDEFETRGLTPGFVAEEAGDLRVDAVERAIHAVVGVCGLSHSDSSLCPGHLPVECGQRGDFIGWDGGKPITAAG